MNFGLTKQEIKAIHAVFAQQPAVEEVIIFGSRAMGNFKTASDIDLAIKGKNIDFALLGKIKAQLEETIPVPYFFDLIDLATITNPELKKHIEEYGKLFYKSAIHL